MPAADGALVEHHAGESSASRRETVRVVKEEWVPEREEMKERGTRTDAQAYAKS